MQHSHISVHEDQYYQANIGTLELLTRPIMAQFVMAGTVSQHSETRQRTDDPCLGTTMSLTGRVCPVRVVCRVKVSRRPDCSVPVEDVEITAPPTAAALGEGVILSSTQNGVG
jgi:hypothetical protein